MKFSKKQIEVLELFYKALANKKRLKILMLIAERDGINVEQISKHLNIYYQTAAIHTQHLEKVGFVYKKNKNTQVQHTISERGKLFLNFCEKLVA